VGSLGPDGRLKFLSARRGYYQATVGREDAAVLRKMLLPESK
jgi:hypothetical protein